MIEEIEIVPDKSLMEKMGFVGFSPELAFAEFIDNSIDAKYDEISGKEIISERITIEISHDADRLLISDNSSGIKAPQEALRLASSTKKNRLGTFGLGLKTAAMTLGKRLEIKTKYVGDSYGTVITLDPEEWDEKRRWKATKETYQENSDDHYTKIEISKLLVDPGLYEWEQIRKDLAFRFSEFINNDEVEICVDDVLIKVEEMQFISQEELKTRLDQFGIPLSQFPSSRKYFQIDIDDMKIEGWIDILDKFSQIGRFGFNLYRGRRLISPFEKCCGIANHPRHSRLFGHIYLPFEFPVTFTKDGFEIGRRDWKKLNSEIKKIIQDHLSFCNKLAQYRKTPQVKPQTVKRVDEYLNKIEDAVKESKLINRLWESEEKKQKTKEEKSEGIDKVDIEKRSPKIHPSFKKPIPKGTGERQPRSKTQKKKTFYLTLPGRGKIKIEHIFDSIEEPPVRMHYRYFDKESEVLQVTTNTSFESWGLTNDESFYAAVNIMDVLSDFIFYHAENPSCSITDIKEDLWRHVGRITARSL